MLTAPLRFAAGPVAAFAMISASPLHAEQLADFTLTDLNPNSERSGEDVSPRDYLHQVTAYYFGSAT